MSTTEAPPAEAPAPDVSQVILHVPGEHGGMDELTAEQAARELASMQDDIQGAREVLTRASDLEDALTLVMPVGTTLHVGGGRAWSLVQPEGSRTVVPEVFRTHQERLVAMGLAEVEEFPATRVYTHGGVKALTSAAALAALQAAGIEGLVVHTKGHKKLVLTEGVPAPTDEEAPNGR